MNIEEATFRPASARVAWAETLIGTLIIPVIGLIFHRQDPLFLHSGFVWLVFPPLLFGIRYGFVYGFSSALLTAFFMWLESRYTAAVAHGYPYQYALSVIVVGMIAGQFADIWLRRFQRSRLFNEYVSTRLNSFRRSYQLLKVSHDELEERLAGDLHNPRSALAALRQRFANDDDPHLLKNQSADVLEFLATQGQVRQASLYEVFDNTRIGETPLASLGGKVRCPADHPMLKMCLDQRVLVSLRNGDTQLSERQKRQGMLAVLPLAVLPLADIDGRIWAVVVIAAMPFVTYNNRTLNLLAVLGANLGEIIARAARGVDRVDDGRRDADFQRALVVWTDYAKRYRADATLMGVWLAAEISADAASARADDWLLEQVRGADAATRFENREGGHSVLVLMPMTNATGAAGYRRRILRLLEERLGKAPDDTLVVFHERQIDGKVPAQALLADLSAECGVVRA